MAAQRKRWVIPPRIPGDSEQALGVFHPVLRQTLYNLGYADQASALSYLNAEPPSGTEPWNLLGMNEAVERLTHAIRSGQPVVVYGDYDVDGVTATALLTLVIRRLGGSVQPYIPNRFDEGYGLNMEALSSLKEEGAKIVVTVDCGIRSLAEAEFAKENGLEMIISDHHHPGAELPPALAVINPKQSGDSYPEKELAGVGLAYKLAAALIEKLQPDQIDPKSFLDLVALGTVADLAPLQGENRALVREGLRWLRHAQRQGLLSLMGVARLRPMSITASDIGFGLGPRLNAAGRLDSAHAALNLLMTDDVFEAGYLAQQLEVQNRERQRITHDIMEQAEALALESDPDASLLFAAHPDFNAGVVGLAASRLNEAYYRPAIVAHANDEYTRGSCRSIPEFHITEALDQCADLLVRYGGHKAAAGFTVLNHNLPLLVERLKSIAAAQLEGKDLRPTIKIDQEIALRDLDAEAYKALMLMEPTGYGNPQAIFASRDLRVVHSRPVGRDGSHLKMIVSDDYVTFDAIAFRQGHLQEQMPDRLDLAYIFETNEYNGRVSFQLRVKDLKPAGLPD